jgi:hypothetical protein
MRSHPLDDDPDKFGRLLTSQLAWINAWEAGHPVSSTGPLGLFGTGVPIHRPKCLDEKRLLDLPTGSGKTRIAASRASVQRLIIQDEAHTYQVIDGQQRLSSIFKLLVSKEMDFPPHPAYTSQRFLPLGQVDWGTDRPWNDFGLGLTLQDARSSKTASARPAEVGRPSERSTGGSGQGYELDKAVRDAVEAHAEAMATALYQAAGYVVTKIGAPYDLRVVRDGEERHVEVKGTRTQDADEVELTIGEVNHAPTIATNLVVVDQIRCDRMPDGLVTSGGRLRWWKDWIPAQEALRPTRFRYRLPPGGQHPRPDS